MFLPGKGSYTDRKLKKYFKMSTSKQIKLNGLIESADTVQAGFENIYNLTQKSTRLSFEKLFPRRSTTLKQDLLELNSIILGDLTKSLEIVRNKTVCELNATISWSFPEYGIYKSRYLSRCNNSNSSHSVKCQTDLFYSKNIKSMSGRHDKFLATLNSLPNTLAEIRVETRWRHLETYMNVAIHSSTLNLCDYMEVMYKVSSGMTCSSNPENGWIARALRKDHLASTLPGEFVHQKDGITLTYIHVLKHAYVSKEGDVFVGRLKISKNNCHKRIIKTYPDQYTQEQTMVYDEVFTIANIYGGTYYHFMVEHLSRIAPFVTFLADNQSIKIHLSTYIRQYIRNFISHFNITRSRIITGSIRARVLYRPQSGPCTQPVLFNTRLQSMIHRSTISEPPEPRKSIILMKRSRGRWFNNHAQIKKKLQELATEYSTEQRIFNSAPIIHDKIQTSNTSAYIKKISSDVSHYEGYSVEEFDDSFLPSTTETVAMFNRAFMIVAPHGAGQSNLLFSEPGTILIEALCNEPYNLAYRSLSESLGHIYNGFLYKELDCFNVTAELLAPYVKFYLEKIRNRSARFSDPKDLRLGKTREDN